MAIKYDCWDCKKQVTATKNNRYRSHSNGDGEPCAQSSVEIPEHILENPVGADDAPDVPREGVDFAVCPNCDRKVKLTQLGYFEPHDKTLRGADRCPLGGVRAKHAKKQTDVPLPGDDVPRVGATVPRVPDSSRPVANRGLAVPSAPTPGAREDAAGTTTPDSPTPRETPSPTLPADTPPPSGTDGPTDSPESTTTSQPSELWTEALDSFFLETAHVILMDALAPSPEFTGSSATTTTADQYDDVLFEKRASKFPPRSNKPMRKMTEREQELAGRIKEIFYAYTNRDSSDNRSAQKTLGPSEAGSPCDRQIAMKLLGIEPVNPQESWAPFVGTAVHEELARMFEWANGQGSGRFVTEMSVSFGSPNVPRGTLDLLDRVLYMVDDHKLMGRWSLEQLRKEGPSETYRKQLQIYGLGAELAGEVVREVALIAWPRQESTLNKLFVHVEPYDRRIAQEALDRVERIAQEVQSKTGPGTPRQPMTVAQSFEMADDCKWCPFHLEGDKGFTRGCAGK